MSQPHEDENPDAVAAAPGQIENQSNPQIAPAIPAGKAEPDQDVPADRRRAALQLLAARLFERRRS